MKFFSLIHGGDITPASDSKIIPAKSFEKLLTAVQLVTQAKKDVEKFHQELAQEAQEAKARAEKEGFQAGMEAWAEQLKSFETGLEQYKKKVEELVLPIALKAAKKVVNRELELHPEAIVDIVRGVLKSVAAHKQVTIYANKKDLEFLESNKKSLKDQLEKVESLSIQERADIAPGGCMIETEGGIINAQIENQWQTLEHAFTAATKKK